MARRFTRPLCTISSVDQIKRSRAPRKPKSIGTQPNHFNQPFKSDTRLISPAPISTSRP